MVLAGCQHNCYPVVEGTDAEWTLSSLSSFKLQVRRSGLKFANGWYSSFVTLRRKKGGISSVLGPIRRIDLVVSRQSRGTCDLRLSTRLTTFAKIFVPSTFWLQLRLARVATLRPWGRHLRKLDLTPPPLLTRPQYTLLQGRNSLRVMSTCQHLL